MSDLYLLLRRRLEEVVDWVFIDTAILREARKRKGLSYETLGRRVHVSGKTWERYEKVGRVPRPLLPRIARVLDLEIEEPARLRVVVEAEPEDDGDVAARLLAVEVQLQEQGVMLSELLELARRRRAQPRREGQPASRGSKGSG